MLRIAVIGLGVGEMHARAYASDSRCLLTSLCDIDPDKLATVGERFPGVRLTLDAAEVLADPDVDAVSIATYDDAHAAQVVAALRAGKHVFVEKPLCLSDDELDTIASLLADAPDLVLSSNLILRRVPRFNDIRRRIQDGMFGALFLVEGDYTYGRLDKITHGWRGRLPIYSVMHGGGIHLIDLLMWMTGQRPVEVMALGTRVATRGSAFSFDDTILAMLRFPGGLLGKLSANFACVRPHGHQLTIYGTAATYVHRPAGGELYHSRDPGVAPEILDDPYPGYGKGDLIPSFIDSVVADGVCQVGAGEVLDAMAASLAIERACREGRAVPVRYRTGDGWGRRGNR